MKSATKAACAAVLLGTLEVHAFTARLPLVQRVQTPLRARSSMTAPVMSSTEGAKKAVASALLTTTIAAALAATPATAAEAARWAVSEFLDNLSSDSVERVVFSADSKELLALDADGARHAVEILPSEVPDLVKSLRAKDVPFAVQAAPSEDSNALANLAVNLLFPLALLSGLFFLGRRGGGPMGGGPPGGPMQMLQPRSKIELEPKTGVTFDDVAGCDASKLELEEVVDFLSNPEKFTKVGAQAPRGVLLEGPPGTGKTLLARAVAGEAGVPFISTSGSEFVEMFVGVGASRIRSLFADAKKNAPCIIFIDEIDAIGRQRAQGGGFATNDEREQTLNQILTEMDGFSGNTGVIVIAATNRGDILDNALLRPGRFDRRVPVDLPDKQGRVAILKVHVRDKPLAPDVDLDSIASRTIGFSGASLQNLMNEAAIVAARNGKDVITFDEIDYAIDRLTVGMQKTTTSPTQSKASRMKRQNLVAFHEAGHAVMAALTPGYDSVAKVTIIPRSNGAGGFTLFTPSEDRMESGLYSLRYLKAQLAVALGGRVAEELAFGADEVTTGASNDLQQVRNLARRMIAQWGFRATPDETNIILDAPVAWETPDAGQQMFGGPQTASEATEQAIDAEVKALVAEAYDVCKATLKDNWRLMEALVGELLENETVEASALQRLVLEHTAAGSALAAL
eukprot:CAMPEP_0185689874 /NCGR_PEP_ID=MMETSP1164-20130828/744_1 /TAXON_ID=1104430 /ORGANISM="Chrysoreinhardia sp, Strain CCMP2950" /LENGTH=682 /DNA_ID=CAMNT_0028356401 /DNA_START=59 /DNA_END=2107 /DNA_ORIENTATION=+